MEPIIVSVGNTSQIKLKAIDELARTVGKLADALNSINVRVRVENCNIQTDGTGVEISTANDVSNTEQGDQFNNIISGNCMSRKP